MDGQMPGNNGTKTKSTIYIRNISEDPILRDIKLRLL